MNIKPNNVYFDKNEYNESLYVILSKRIDDYSSLLLAYNNHYNSRMNDILNLVADQRNHINKLQETIDVLTTEVHQPWYKKLLNCRIK